MNDDLMTKMAEILAAQSDLLKEMSGLQTKAPATTFTATPLHGSGGIWQGPGLDRDVITAHIRPHGIASALPMFPSVDENPRFASLTGFTDVSGSEPTNACDDAPAGYVKGCNLTARFGLARRDTNTIEMDKVMLRINRGDFMDLVLRGRVLGLTGLEPSGLNENQILDLVTMSEMVNTGVQIERLLSRQLWQGVLTNVNEFPGLDVQIATGQKDADTGTLCPALDSYVVNYGYATLANSLVTQVAMMEFYLRYNAEKMGLDPVDWVLVMRPELWYELSAIWPCAYNTNRCGTVVESNSTVFIDGRENVAERDAMRNGMYIYINGNRYRVITDTGIFEHNNANNGSLNPGEYASSIYMVPLTITGNFPVTYRQYVNYNAAAADINLLRGREQFFWTDNGLYSWAIEQVKWCYKLALKTEQRIILRTPQLAGRIDAIKYIPAAHLREPYPDSPYFADGGVSLRTSVGTPYAVWGN